MDQTSPRDIDGWNRCTLRHERWSVGQIVPSPHPHTYAYHSRYNRLYIACSPNSTAVFLVDILVTQSFQFIQNITFLQLVLFPSSGERIKESYSTDNLGRARLKRCSRINESLSTDNLSRDRLKRCSRINESWSTDNFGRARLKRCSRINESCSTDNLGRARLKRCSRINESCSTYNLGRARLKRCSKELSTMQGVT
jgi:hypothetical protein